MITMYKGNAEKPDTFRLLLSCDQCHVHVKTDVPLHTKRDQGDTATESYLERARVELAQVCPHMQEELDQQEKEGQPSHQETWNASQRRSCYRGGA